jgi:low temperature requirement protein LtrA
MNSIHDKSWWGAPKKFSTKKTERKITWLELFYDLVYVIVISRTTHHFAEHPDLNGLIYYVYLFAMIFWGWYNGSLYYDIHGSPGIRTNLMILWQMLAVAVLAVTQEFTLDENYFALTVALMFLQGFITYLWFSVGIYDPEHRKLNVPYSICFVLSFILLFANIYIPQPFKAIVFWGIILLNYLPPFIIKNGLRRNGKEFSLSSGMTERLGLLTIIVFGEGILGIINGMHGKDGNNWNLWLCFGLGILIVFSLWFIFFSLVSDRDCKPGFRKGQKLPLMYIPALLSLGMIGASFTMMLSNEAEADGNDNSRLFFGLSIAVFLTCIYGISTFLIYRDKYQNKSMTLCWLLIIPAVIIAAVTWLPFSLTLLTYLIIVLMVLIMMIVAITRIWFGGEANSEEAESTQTFLQTNI